MNVQGPHARRDIDDPGSRGAQLRFERMDAEAQVEVEHVGAVFDQQIAVAIGAADHAGRLPENGFRGAVAPEAHQVAGRSWPIFHRSASRWSRDRRNRRGLVHRDRG